MLVLTRKIGQQIRVGDNIVVTILQTEHNKIRIGIEAPPEVTILREELVPRRAKRFHEAKFESDATYLQAEYLVGSP